MIDKETRWRLVLMDIIEKNETHFKRCCKVYEETVTVRDKEIDRLRKMLGMKPLKEQKPAQVLQLVKK